MMMMILCCLYCVQKGCFRVHVASLVVNLAVMRVDVLHWCQLWWWWWWWLQFVM